MPVLPFPHLECKLRNSSDDSDLAASIEPATTAGMVGTKSKAVICISYIVYYVRFRIAMYLHQPVWGRTIRKGWIIIWTEDTCPCWQHSSDVYTLLQNSSDDSYLAASIEPVTTASVVAMHSKAVICIFMYSHVHTPTSLRNNYKESMNKHMKLACEHSSDDFPPEQQRFPGRSSEHRTCDYSKYGGHA